MPPLHHQLVTREARRPGRATGAARRAGASSSTRSPTLEARYEPTPAGLGVTVAWGLPYFRRYVAEAGRRGTCRSTAAPPKAKGRQVRALLDAVRFPSDPPTTILEQNDVAVLLLRGTISPRSRTAANALVGEARLLAADEHPPGVRRRRLRRRAEPAQADGHGGRRPGADLIPDSAELFLGFTSTQKAGLGPPRIANLETLGYSTAGRAATSGTGRHMHVSHICSRTSRTGTSTSTTASASRPTFRPGLTCRSGR